MEHDDTEIKTRHTSKKLHSKHGTAGVLIEKRTGYTGYLAYCRPLVIEHYPGIAGGHEQIQCRIGDSSLTIEGRNLQPIAEDLRAERCEYLRESDPNHMNAPVLPYLAQMTLRLWL